jgi:hypothetical protein
MIQGNVSCFSRNVALVILALVVVLAVAFSWFLTCLAHVAGTLVEAKTHVLARRDSLTCTFQIRSNYSSRGTAAPFCTWLGLHLAIPSLPFSDWLHSPPRPGSVFALERISVHGCNHQFN